MPLSESTKLVVALYNFKRKNNDELCFQKGDIITITQMDDGGWWEGTLHDKTGWFPSNYVRDYKLTDASHTLATVPEKVGPDLLAQQKANRTVVLKDIIDSEQANVAELQGLITNFLQPLQTTNLLTRDEYKQLIGNIYDVMDVHQDLLRNLEAIFTQDPDAKVGHLFLNIAARMKSVHVTYCSCHPEAVCILDRFRDELNEFMERTGAVSPGILVLTTGLSKPFRRLEKYSALLKELERHMEKNHPDRGDTQRSVLIYREIAEKCNNIRKQKELALTVLAGGIKGWEGEDLHTLGIIIYVAPVTLVLGMDHRDRYFVLFSTTLLVLSMSQRMSSFIYEGKLPLTGITVVKLDDIEDMKNGFEISGPMIETITVLCPSQDERQRWIEYLSQEQCVGLVTSPTSPHVSRPPNGKPLQTLMEKCHSQEIKIPWSLASLRPSPPLYSSKNYDERLFEEDALILKVIEGYCATANARLTIHSDVLEDELFSKACHRISGMKNKIDIWESNNSRSVSKTIDLLKKQMADLQSQMILLAKQLDEERNSRLALAAFLKRHMSMTDTSIL